MSSVKSCRVCAQPLASGPLLSYRGMPAAAQGFPDAQQAAGDAGADLDIHECPGCGLVQLPAEPVPYYREVIRAAGISPVLCEAKRRQFSDFIRRHGLAGRKVIEIGCGAGEFLSILDQLPVEAHGIEFSDASVRQCRGAGLKVTHGYPDATSRQFPGAPFDAFFLLMFLEHMPDPNASLQAIRRALAPGALGLVEVPNFDMMVRQRLFSEFISDHLMYFSRRTLIATLERNGFDVIGTEELRDDYVLSLVVKKREPLDLSEFARFQAKITADLNGFVARFPSGQVAVWGAGHQALAVLALSGIAPSIRYVVDSALFKQGKFTPATHLPVVPPETLKSDPVEAVIIMAASYSDEVAQIIARDYGDGLEVAILRDQGLEMVTAPR